ncbi:sigma-70 family RNA polymerase sigma factor [Dactylosporangium vinaceum]|uniref:Sigma-70 family RNA polymerase sigma factor n=1 Tax=Dactylosporangium vinaceum TaxID=53362 RepID=A0ABV5MEN7_9ACTN|nr:sigma-70 family RNA polymerase sigma factor [Dactylosporangium vinaceum]UAB92351.1 sigma-70 family RNA polymerase sigma factor [Dactylosporangium vinaceum]
MELSMTLSSRPRESLVELDGVLDYASVPYLRQVVYERFDSGCHDITVDAARARLIDAASIKVLLYLQQRAEKAGGRLRVTGARGIALTALEIAGVAKELDAYADLDWPEADRDRTPVDSAALHIGHGHWPVGVTELIGQLYALAPDDPRRARRRDEIIAMCLPAARNLARRYAGSGEPVGDLVQVASLGLVKAVDGFDPERGLEFGAYATPTVAGELKRYFRDRTSAVRVPRRLQELRLEMGKAREELGSTATVADLAAHLGVGEAEVAEVITAGHMQHPMSIDAPAGPESDDATIADGVGGDDPAFGLVDLRVSLPAVIRSLPEREQRIIALRFYGNLSQSEIAARLGLSQMHISRLLTHALSFLRRRLSEDG